ncbi:MAG: hypothetical protein IPM79_14700 [Polyangiaceae bacterium]|jgi:hypothetical protein|nr:hypothetical protein [Polyangiaceae bacterium]
MHNDPTANRRTSLSLLLGALVLGALTPACVIRGSDFDNDPFMDAGEGGDEADDAASGEEVPEEDEDMSEPEAPEDEPPALVELPMAGGSGGELYVDPCAEGQALVGFGGYLDSRGWHGVMAAGCAELTLVQAEDGSYSVEVGEPIAMPLHGTNGSEPWISACPAGEVVVGFAGRSGALLDQLELACAPFIVVVTEAGVEVGTGEPHFLLAVGGEGGEAFEPLLCEPGRVGMVSRMRAGESIDALGISCGSLAVELD